MKKNYIAPETEQITVHKEQHLCAGTTITEGTGEGGNSGDNGPGMGEEGGVDARQSFGWMWDEEKDNEVW